MTNNCEAYDGFSVFRKIDCKCRVEKPIEANCDRETKNLEQIQSFRAPLVNKGLETSSSPVLTATKSIWRTCRVYHVEFPQILKEQEGTIVQFIWSF